MSYLFDKRYFGEAEDEFENQVSQEQDRYSSLRDRMLSGQTLGYDELEELFAAAKAKNDAHVVDALKNVVGDPPDGEKEAAADKNEELYEEMIEDALRKDEDEIRRPENRPHNLHRADEAELSQGEMDDIADMFAGYSGRSDGDSAGRRKALDFMRRHADELRQMLDQPSQSGGLGDFSHAYDFEANESKDPNGEKLAAAAEGILDEILSLFGVDESGDGVEDAAENIKKILDKAGLKDEEAEKAIVAAEKKAAEKVDPAKVEKAVKSVKAEIEKLDEEEFAEKEELLPDSLVNEALETLRRMY